VFETYRMLGRERENELLAEAERLRPLREHRRASRARLTVFVVGIVAIGALLFWVGMSNAAT
jgi:hypothetical protein